MIRSAILIIHFLTPSRGRNALNSFIFIGLHTLFITTKGGGALSTFQPSKRATLKRSLYFQQLPRRPCRNSFLLKIEIQKTDQREEYFPRARCYPNCEHEEKGEEPGPGPLPPCPFGGFT